MATCPKCSARYADDVGVCEVDGEPLLPDEACAGFDADLEVGELVGEYRVERKIGEGGYGTVYGATHPVIGKSAAIKVLRRQYSSNASVVSRFVAEARAVNQIRHRNIVDIFAFGVLKGGLQYFVMEWLDGVTLAEQLREHGPLPPGRAIDLLRDIGRALDAAHAAGITHRDLKPDNVFICFDDEDSWYPKLLDFGIAKLLGDSKGQHRTETGVAMGTPHYMSPEQCRGQGVDHRADIYSFGAMTHEMLTGEPPFLADSVIELMMMQTTEAPPPMSTIRGELPTVLDAPVLRMLDKDPDERPQTHREAVEELTRAAQAASIDASGARSGGATAAKAAQSLALARTVPSDPTAARLPDAVAESMPVVGSGSLANVEANVAETDDSAALGQSRSRRLLVVAAVLLGAGAVALAVTRTPTADPAGAAARATTEQAAGAPTTSDSAAKPPSTGSATASPFAEVSLTLESTIPDIEVWHEGKRIGTSARKISLRRDSEPLELTLKKDGYRPEKITVTPQEDIDESVTLHRLPRVAPIRKGPGGDGKEVAIPKGWTPPPATE